jgi:DNA-binding transcriptional MerR regulator
MIRIGDFSKLSRVSIKTLRFYDEMGLFKPVEVDRFNGYRYYEFSQLTRLYRILALKDLGFSLEEISLLLEGDVSTEQMRGMLKLRQAEIKRRVEVEAERLARMELWLRQFEQEDTMSKYDVVIKQIEPMRVASVRGIVPTPPEQGMLWGELMSNLNQMGARMIGPPITVYHDSEFKERDWDIEVCMSIADSVTPNARLNFGMLPGFESVACVVHAGPFVTISEAYDALGKWVGTQGYRIVGPSREINLEIAQPPGNQNDPNTVTEIQFPVEKA